MKLSGPRNTIIPYLGKTYFLLRITKRTPAPRHAAATMQRPAMPAAGRLPTANTPIPLMILPSKFQYASRISTLKQPGRHLPFPAYNPYRSQKTHLCAYNRNSANCQDSSSCHRLKQSGMEWTVRGANAIIAMRCAILSNRFEDFWEQRLADAL